MNWGHLFIIYHIKAVCSTKCLYEFYKALKSFTCKINQISSYYAEKVSKHNLLPLVRVE